MSHQELAEQCASYALRIMELETRLAEAEQDRDAGWDAFYKLRKAVGEDRYPGLTNVVRATASASVEPRPKYKHPLIHCNAGAYTPIGEGICICLRGLGATSTVTGGE
jgi:hypothetical protein